MTVKTARELKAVLFDEYGGFADKRVKNLDKDSHFIVDDRSSRDLDARKQLYLWFCQIFAAVQSEDSVRVRFRGDLPIDSNVERWLNEQGVEHTGFGIEFDVGPANRSDLDELAQRVANIVKRRYPVPSYKYVAPRTARSLQRLSATLLKAWGP